MQALSGATTGPKVAVEPAGMVWVCTNLIGKELYAIDITLYNRVRLGIAPQPDGTGIT
jgi:hypothetical protein